MTNALGRTLAVLGAWWFAPTRQHQPGFFRVVLLGWFGWYYAARLFERLRSVADRPVEFYAPPSLAGWLSLPPLSEAWLAWLEPLAVVLLALGFVGLFTRAALIAFAALNLLLGLAANSWGYTAHAFALPTLVLCLMAFAPGVTSFSLDAVVLARWHRRRWRNSDTGTSTSTSTSTAQYPEMLPRRAVSVWPVRGVLLVLCLLYASAGLSKLRYSGWRWSDGNTLAFYLGGGSERGATKEQRFIADPRAPQVERFRDGWGLVDHAYVGSPTPVGLWLSRQRQLLALVSWGALLWELGFSLALFGGWARVLALAGGVGFHVGIHLTLSINFSSYLVCYALFVDWCALARSLRRFGRELTRRAAR